MRVCEDYQRKGTLQRWLLRLLHVFLPFIVDLGLSSNLKAMLLERRVRRGESFKASEVFLRKMLGLGECLKNLETTSGRTTGPI